MRNANGERRYFGIAAAGASQPTVAAGVVLELESSRAPMYTMTTWRLLLEVLESDGQSPSASFDSPAFLNGDSRL